MLSEKIIFFLVRLFPKTNRRLLSAKSNLLDYYRFNKKKASSSFAIFSGFDLSRKIVLDLGCGLGSNILFFLEKGAQQVIAVDVNFQQIKNAQALFAQEHPDLANKICFVVADASEMPFREGGFPVVIAADSLEHVNSPWGMVQEAWRVLAEGGTFLGYFPPFFSPWGAHLINWYPIPWIQLLSSEATLTKIAYRLDIEKISTNSQLPPATQLKIQYGRPISFVNHITVNQFDNLMANLPNSTIRIKKLMPLFWRSRASIQWIFYPLTKLRLTRELFTSKVFFRLDKGFTSQPDEENSG